MRSNFSLNILLTPSIMPIEFHRKNCVPVVSVPTFRKYLLDSVCVFFLFILDIKFVGRIIPAIDAQKQKV